MQPDSFESLQPASGRMCRRGLLLAAGAAGVTWASRGWGMNTRPLPAGLPPTGVFARPQPAQLAPVVATPTPAVPRRVAHPASYGTDALRDWAAFKQRFTTGDGRVVDTGNGGVSHSEGQGWGMLFAVAFDDEPAFDAFHGWTRRNLQRRADALHAWRYVPAARQPVADWNNATDADLFIASALWRASWRWNRPDLADAAAAIARDVLALAVRTIGGRTLLLPGADGFTTHSAVTVNPSYYAFPMLEEMAALQPSDRWDAMRSDGLALLAEARFGRWQLPPDWLRVDVATGELSPHPHWPTRFSYDAIRVPLWLRWANDKTTVIGQSFDSYWIATQTVPPAWIDLKTDISATYPASPGMLAVARTAAALSQCDKKVPELTGIPALSASPDYYSAALILLSRLAWQESRDI